MVLLGFGSGEEVVRPE
jgi:hypothetical protein